MRSLIEGERSTTLSRQMGLNKEGNRYVLIGWESCVGIDRYLGRLCLLPLPDPGLDWAREYGLIKQKVQAINLRNWERSDGF